MPSTAAATSRPSRALHVVSGAGLLGDVAQRALRVADPALGVGSLGRPRQEGAQVLGRLLHVAALEQQERHAVVRAAQRVVQLQRALVVADGLLRLAGLGERDRHVEQDPGVGGIVPEGQPVGGERGLEVPLPLQGQPLVEVVQPLRAAASRGAPCRTGVSRSSWGGGLSEQSRTGTTSWTAREYSRREGPATRRSRELPVLRADGRRLGTTPGGVACAVPSSPGREECSRWTGRSSARSAAPWRSGWPGNTSPRSCSASPRPASSPAWSSPPSSRASSAR